MGDVMLSTAKVAMSLIGSTQIPILTFSAVQFLKFPTQISERIKIYLVENTQVKSTSCYHTLHILSLLLWQNRAIYF